MRAAAWALAVLALAACKQSPMPGAGLAPPIAEVTQLPGLSRLHLRLAHAPAYHSLMLVVHAPSKMKAPRVETLSAAEVDRRTRAKEPLIDQLPRAADTTVRAYIRAVDESLLAAGEAANVTIGKGDNTVALAPVAASGPRLLGASDGVDVSDAVVIKGITVEATTGLPNGLPGIARVDLEIAGPAYADGREAATVASFQAPQIQQYAWRPAHASLQYLPARLGAGQHERPFTLTAKAIDPFGNVVGKTRLALSIVGTAFVDVGFDR